MRQKTLLNLGATFPIPKHRWPKLVEFIEAELARNQSHFAPDPELAKAAGAIVCRLRSRAMAKAETEAMAISAAETINDDTATIRLNSVEIENARSVGCERLALSSLDALGFRDILRDVGLSDRDARIATALVIGRMVHPASERETLRWLETNSAALELLHLDTGQALKCDKLYSCRWLREPAHMRTQRMNALYQAELSGGTFWSSFNNRCERIEHS